VRRIVLWLLSTLSALLLMLGYHTSTSSTPAGGSAQTPVVSSSTDAGSATSGNSSTTTSGGTGGAGDAGTGSAGGRSSTKKGAASTTVTGDVVDTRWGPVQVQLTVSAGTITRVAVVRYPSGNGRDQEINGYALPILVRETTAAQGANIDMVSGATVTSDGYRQSLQSALDKARL
jgi:uncharacterized protein with FMN-binding domain